MCFTRYEIRVFFHEDNEFEYIPFDTLEQARKHAKEHGMHSTDNYDVGIYKVKLYPTSEMVELVDKL